MEQPTLPFARFVLALHPPPEPVRAGAWLASIILDVYDIRAEAAAHKDTGKAALNYKNSEWVHAVLKKRFGVQEMVSKTESDMLFLLQRRSKDPDNRLFLKVINDVLTPTEFSAIARLRRCIIEVNLERSGAASAPSRQNPRRTPLSSLVINATDIPLLSSRLLGEKEQGKVFQEELNAFGVEEGGEKVFSGIDAVCALLLSLGNSNPDEGVLDVADLTFAPGSGRRQKNSDRREGMEEEEEGEEEEEDGGEEGNEGERERKGGGKSSSSSSVFVKTVSNTSGANRHSVTFPVALATSIRQEHAVKKESVSTQNSIKFVESHKAPARPKREPLPLFSSITVFTPVQQPNSQGAALGSSVLSTQRVHSRGGGTGRDRSKMANTTPEPEEPDVPCIEASRTLEPFTRPLSMSSEDMSEVTKRDPLLPTIEPWQLLSLGRVQHTQPPEEKQHDVSEISVQTEFDVVPREEVDEARRAANAEGNVKIHHAEERAERAEREILKMERELAEAHADARGCRDRCVMIEAEATRVFNELSIRLTKYNEEQANSPVRQIPQNITQLTSVIQGAADKDVNGSTQRTQPGTPKASDMSVIGDKEQDEAVALAATVDDLRAQLASKDKELVETKKLHSEEIHLLEEKHRKELADSVKKTKEPASVSPSDSLTRQSIDLDYMTTVGVNTDPWQEPKEVQKKIVTFEKPIQASCETGDKQTQTEGQSAENSMNVMTGRLSKGKSRDMKNSEWALEAAQFITTINSLLPGTPEWKRIITLEVGRAIIQKAKLSSITNIRVKRLNVMGLQHKQGLLEVTVSDEKERKGPLFKTKEIPVSNEPQFGPLFPTKKNPEKHDDTIHLSNSASFSISISNFAQGKKAAHKALPRQINLTNLCPFLPETLQAETDRRLGDVYIIGINGMEFIEPNEFYKPPLAEDVFPKRFTLFPPEELLHDGD